MHEGLNVPQPRGFKCTQCGNCCRNFNESCGVFLGEVDLKNISKFLRKDVKEVFIKYCTESIIAKQKFYKLKHTKNGECIFLQSNQCSINPAKPLQCQLGPFGYLYDKTDKKILNFDCAKKLNLTEWSTKMVDHIILDLILAPQKEENTQQ